MLYRFVELITLKNRYHCSNVLFRQDFAAYCLSNRIRGLNFNNPWWYKAKRKSYEEMIIFFVPAISLLFLFFFHLFLNKKVLATPRHAHIDPRSPVIATTRKRWFFANALKVLCSFWLLMETFLWTGIQLGRKMAWSNK